MIGIKMYTMVELMLEHNVIEFLDWMIHSHRFIDHMLNVEKMTKEDLASMYDTDIGISTLRGKALELFIDETNTDSVWLNDRWRE